MCCMYDNVCKRTSVCFTVCFSLFVYVSECVFPFQTCTQHPHTQTSTSACGHSDSGSNIWDCDTLHSSVTAPSPFSFFFLSPLLFIHHMQRDKQSSGERGLGPFSKDTFEMAQHVTEGYPSPCQAVPAMCGQVYLKAPRINTLPPDTHAFSIHKNPNTEAHTHSIPSLTHAAFHVMP